MSLCEIQAGMNIIFFFFQGILPFCHSVFNLTIIGQVVQSVQIWSSGIVLESGTIDIERYALCNVSINNPPIIHQ